MFYYIYFLSLFSLIFFLFRHFRILVPGDCNFKFTVLYNNIYTRFTVSILEIKVFMKKILKLSHFFKKKKKKKKRQILNLSQYFAHIKNFKMQTYLISKILRGVTILNVLSKYWKSYCRKSFWGDFENVTLFLAIFGIDLHRKHF